MQQRPAGVLAALGLRRFQGGTENQRIHSKLHMYTIIQFWLPYVTSFVKTIPNCTPRKVKQ